MTEATSSDMRWHKEGCEKDNIMPKSADSLAWKHFDSEHKNFSSDAHNVRLGLASDGFNPYGTVNVSYSFKKNVSYSCWPVILIPYNLSRWICLKQSYALFYEGVQ